MTSAPRRWLNVRWFILPPLPKEATGSTKQCERVHVTANAPICTSVQINCMRQVLVIDACMHYLSGNLSYFMCRFTHEEMVNWTLGRFWGGGKAGRRRGRPTDRPFRPFRPLAVSFNSRQISNARAGVAARAPRSARARLTYQYDAETHARAVVASM